MKQVAPEWEEPNAILVPAPGRGHLPRRAAGKDPMSTAWTWGTAAASGNHPSSGAMDDFEDRIPILFGQAAPRDARRPSLC
jgi:hypothetical protein